MKFSLHRALIIARREYLTTVRRKAFLFSILITPLLLFVSTMLSKLGNDDALAHAHQGRIVALVDSSGVFENAERTYEYVTVSDSIQVSSSGVKPVEPHREVVPVVIRPFGTLREATDSLNAGTVNTALLIPANFLQTGGVRRYEKDTRTFTGSADDRAIRFWMTRSLLASAVDSTRIARVLGLSRTSDLYVPSRGGNYELKDDARELWTFFLPFGLALILAIAIITGGQYLLQGISEEKETRILESLLCTVSPDDLMVGKLVGLGSAGLTMVGVWLVFGLGAAAPALAMLKFEFSPLLVLLAVVYFFLGYLFYASLMTGIGAITNNLREAQQLAVTFTMMNFIPFYALMQILNNPGSPITVGLSLFPPTAPTTMMMRLSVSAMTGAEVPLWQLGLSLALLAITSVVTVRVSSKVFRLGLLLYGKTPNLPEILRIIRKG
jgi:ABC-2 type transport system permease protein